MKPSDLATATLPPVLAVTLGQIHTIIGIIGGLLGIAYLLWKWRKEAKS